MTNECSFSVASAMWWMGFSGKLTTFVFCGITFLVALSNYTLVGIPRIWNSEEVIIKRKLHQVKPADVDLLLNISKVHMPRYYRKQPVQIKSEILDEHFAKNLTLQNQLKMINEERVRIGLTQMTSYERVHKDGKLLLPLDVRCEQKRRKELVEKVCADYKARNTDFTRPEKLKYSRTYDMVLVDDKRKVLYCELPKAACTSWKVLFSNLTGKVNKTEFPILHQLVHDTTARERIGLRYLDSYSQPEREERINTYFKFMFTRHPLSRIISAYENKLANSDSSLSEWYREKVGRHIAKNYRTNATKHALENGDDISFAELVKFVGNPDEHFNSRYDGHWWTIQSVCEPCLFKYDYYAKIETIEEDAKEIFAKMGLPVDTKLPSLNTKKVEDSHKNIPEWYSGVSQKDYDNLLNVYEPDLRMFGYGSDKDRNLLCGAGDIDCC